MSLTYTFGGSDERRRALVDRGDLVVVRSNRRGARHDQSPLSASSRAAIDELTPLFGFPAAGVGVYGAPVGHAEELSDVLDSDVELQFAGRGLRDEYGAPVVYTENVFVKFADRVTTAECEAIVEDAGLLIKRALPYARNAFFLGGPPRVGRQIFARADELVTRDDVELCHPELIREIGWCAAHPSQWHLQRAEIGGTAVDAHVNVLAAWQVARGEGVVIAVIDDGFDLDHREFASEGKIVAPYSVSAPRGVDPRPADGDNHGTACAGVACADGVEGASGVAPGAALMPLRCTSGVGSQDEADAIAYAAAHGADVISCSRGPVDGRWWAPHDPAHLSVVPLPDSTRLAIDYAISHGRGGRGCVITWAAGNGNESVDNDGYASYRHVVAVGACNDTATKALYSDYGRALWCCFPSDHGRTSITPGIWTTDRSGSDGYNPGDESIGDSGGNYTNSFGGTSSACPGVAGVAALVLSRNADLRADEVKEILKSCCERIDERGGAYDARGHSLLYGFGRVNAGEAVRLAAPGTAPGPTAA